MYVDGEVSVGGHEYLTRNNGSSAAVAPFPLTLKLFPIQYVSHSFQKYMYTSIRAPLRFLWSILGALMVLLRFFLH